MCLATPAEDTRYFDLLAQNTNQQESGYLFVFQLSKFHNPKRLIK